MKRQHIKRMDRAERCCAAFRQYYSMSVHDQGRKEVLAEAIHRLISWMKVAPVKVKYAIGKGKHASSS